MSQPVKRSLLVVVLALIGVSVSLMIDTIHARLVADHSYASFCNVSSAVNCDVVLGSRYALLLGIPLSRWAILFYLTVIGLAVVTARAERATLREGLARLVLILQVWGVLFSVYLAVIAASVLQTVCLMCGALYLVNLGLFVAAWRLRSCVRVVGRRQRAEAARSDRLVIGGSAVAAAALVAFAGWGAFGGHARTSDPEEIRRRSPDFYNWYFQQPVVDVPAGQDHSLGDASAPVTVVEFSDFECGHCYKFHKSLEDVLRTSGRDVRVVFRHFPLDASCNPAVGSRLHEQACLAAAASECAREQGKFWEYHRLLFDNQQQLGREFLIVYAERVGLDRGRFVACLGGADARARVERDAKDGAQLGVDSTPTVFINGRRIKGALDADRLADALVLARARP